ncbi:glycosyltransferase family 4 protein [Nostoc sp.]|uniref:glycosyltransferase family 4 protein n=1 Tax=Nostoc sp. TaxID=1180 RepID=UPI002FF769FC
MVNKILICSNFYPPFFIGGAEIIAHEQACKLRAAGYDVAVFCAKHDDSCHRYSMTRETFDKLQVFRVIQHAQDYHVNNNFYKPVINKLFNTVIDEFQPDVVHFHNIIGLSLGIVEITYRRKIRTVLTLHDHWGFCFKNTLLKAADIVCKDFSQCEKCLPELLDNQERRLHIRMRNDYIALQLSKVDQFVSPSSYLASAYIKAGFSSDRLTVISYGIDVKRFSKITKKLPEAVMRFTFIGYLGVHKGVHVLMAAIKLLLERGYLGNLFTVNIVGTGGMAEDINKFVTENKLNAVIKLWGKVKHSEIEAVYQSTDVLINPSIWPENEPVTILEAMAARIPILASALGGNLDLVVDGVNGYLFASGNAQMLAEKMVDMALDHAHVELMGQNAYQCIANDTLENYVQQIDQVYQEKNYVSNPVLNRIILCSGKHVSPECFRAISHFNQNYHNNCYKFIMSDWISSEEWDLVDMLWIVDDKGNKQDIVNALKRGRPLLVPESNHQLVELCRSSQSGLFYADEMEAEACLNYLIREKSILTVLGRNAKNYFETVLKR